MIGNAFKIRYQIIENKALVDAASALLKAFNVIEFHLIGNIINDLLKRFNLHRKLNILSRKRSHGDIKNFPDRCGNDRDLMMSFLGKRDLFFVNLPGTACNVHRMIRQSLKIRQGMKKYGGFSFLSFRKILSRELHKERTEFILVMISGILKLCDLVIFLITVSSYKMYRIKNSLLSFFSHA